jgi:phosphoserine phosphatase
MKPDFSILPKEIVLVVDLDGTLIFQDLMKSLFFNLLKERPLEVLSLSYTFLTQGYVNFKVEIAERATKLSFLPDFNQTLLNDLKGLKQRGHLIFLATGSVQEAVERHIGHLDVFDEIIGTKKNEENFTGLAKWKYFASRFPNRDICYFGNSRVDLAIWQKVRFAVAVNASKKLRKKVSQLRGYLGYYEA